jgi:hypothetical protein
VEGGPGALADFVFGLKWGIRSPHRRPRNSVCRRTEGENASRRAEGNLRDASLRVTRRVPGNPLWSIRLGLRGEDGVPQDQDHALLLCNRRTIIEMERRPDSGGYKRANFSDDSLCPRCHLDR